MDTPSPSKPSSSADSAGTPGGAQRRLARPTLRSRLLRHFSLAILLPSLVTSVVGVGMIRHRVLAQAQARVNSDLEAASVLYQNTVDNLRNAVRIHGTRMVFHGALVTGDTANLETEMDRVRQIEQLDVLTLTDEHGHLFFQSGPTTAVPGEAVSDELVGMVLEKLAPVAGTTIVQAAELERIAPALARQAQITVRSTRRGRAVRDRMLKSGMMIKAAAPVFTPSGRLVGVLLGGILLTRNDAIIDRIRESVFRQNQPGDLPAGTATIFQQDVRIATTVLDENAVRAIGTQASAEVADEVLTRGGTWRGRAFVVNDWYLAAYSPIRDLRGTTIGMLYVGTLERPFRNSLWRNLLVFLSIAGAGIGLAHFLAVRVARSIAGPISDLTSAAQRVARGDYSQGVAAPSDDELGSLANSFNVMLGELNRAREELRASADGLERTVAQRTAELTLVQAELGRSEKMAAIGKLAAGLAQEVHAPLTAILTRSTALLEDLPDDDPSRDQIHSILTDAQRCRRSVKSLLDFSRQTRSQRARVSMNQLIEQSLEACQARPEFRGITIERMLDPALPVIFADPAQIRQVLDNVFANAAEAMSRGGDLTIVSACGGPRTSIEIRISDTGPGLHEEVRRRVFEPFFTTRKDAAGLGLAVAYGIVEQHQGTLRLDSVRGEGTTVTLTLPIDAPPGGEGPAPATPPATPTAP
jgi:two-component system NtrC family sensor kinase